MMILDLQEREEVLLLRYKITRYGWQAIQLSQ